MISELSDLPDGVIGFEASGKLQADDYRNVLMPAVSGAAQSGNVRIVLVFRDFDGVSGSAMWQDTKLGVEHLGSWKRIALVTDEGWMTHLADLFGWLTPGELKTFSLAQRDDAIAWAAG